MKIRIVEVINSLKCRGGAQVFFCNLCTELSNRDDVDLHVICLYDQIDSSFEFLTKNNKLHFYKCGKAKFRFIKSSLKLKRIIKQIDPDIINFHLGFLTTYFFGFGIRKRKWRLIKTYHSIPKQDLNAINYFFEKLYVSANKLTFIAISDSIEAESRRIYKKADTFTIYNAIPVSSNAPSNVCLEYDFLCVASLIPVKNHILLFEAFSELLNSFPSVKLVCVGGGELFPEYKKTLLDKGLQDNVLLVGEIQNPKQYYEKSNIFILSSVREGNPIALLEAMSFGKIIIAPRVGGIPDIVEDGVNGFLYEVNDKTKLVQLMKYCIENNDTINNIRTINIEKSKLYSITKCADNYLDVFRKLINKNTRRTK